MRQDWWNINLPLLILRLLECHTDISMLTILTKQQSYADWQKHWYLSWRLHWHSHLRTVRSERLLKTAICLVVSVGLDEKYRYELPHHHRSDILMQGPITWTEMFSEHLTPQVNYRSCTQASASSGWVWALKLAQALKIRWFAREGPCMDCAQTVYYILRLVDTH